MTTRQAAGSLETGPQAPVETFGLTPWPHARRSVSGSWSFTAARSPPWRLISVSLAPAWRELLLANPAPQAQTPRRFDAAYAFDLADPMNPVEIARIVPPARFATVALSGTVGVIGGGGESFGTNRDAYFPSFPWIQAETPAATPTATPEETPVVTRTPGAACPGDCDGDERVSISELIRGVAIALGNAPIEQCEPADGDGSGTITISELIMAVNRALNGC